MKWIRDTGFNIDKRARSTEFDIVFVLHTNILNMNSKPLSAYLAVSP